MKNTVKLREIEVHVQWNDSDNPFWVTFWRFYKDPERAPYYASYHFPTKESLSRIEHVMDHAQIQGKYGEGFMTVLGTFSHKLKRPDEKLKVFIAVEGGVVKDEQYDRDLITLEVHDLDTGWCEICEDRESTGTCVECGFDMCDECKPIHDCQELQRNGNV